MHMENLKNLFQNENEVKEYWKKTGAHTLSPDALQKLKKKMLYDHTWGITVDAFIDSAKLNDQKRVLDAGCGWGRTIIGLRRNIPDLDIVGVDITPELIAMAKVMLLKEADDKNTLFKVGNIQNLEFPDNSFDAVISTRVLHYVSDPQKAMKEFERVVKPGGRVVVILPNKLNPLIYIKYHTKLYSPAHLRNWFKNTSLKIVSCGSIGYIPPIYRFRNSPRIINIDKISRKIPLLQFMGGLAMCVGEK